MIVAGTDVDSPAREAGLKPQDRLLAIEGEPITALMEEDLPEVRRRLALLAVDAPVELTVLRDGKELALKLSPRAKGRVLGEELSCPRWDFTVKEINQFEVPDLFFHLQEGLYVRGVRSPGNADGSGLRARDLLLKVNGLPVRKIEDVRKLHADSLKRLADGGSRRLVLSVLRNGQQMQVVLDISRDYANR